MTIRTQKRVSCRDKEHAPVQWSDRQGQHQSGGVLTAMKLSSWLTSQLKMETIRHFVNHDVTTQKADIVMRRKVCSTQTLYQKSLNEYWFV
jgi:hypothetical protein